jgi:hypothetical protein
MRYPQLFPQHSACGSHARRPTGALFADQTRLISVPHAPAMGSRFAHAACKPQTSSVKLTVTILFFT